MWITAYLITGLHKMKENLFKIFWIFAAVTGAYALIYKPVKQQAENAGADVPFYLTYNYPPGFTAGGMSLIPSGLIGQENAAINPGKCDACSLFPTVNQGRL